MTTDAVTALEQQAPSLTATCQALRVTDAATFAEAGELAKTVAIYIKRVGAVMDPICQATDHAHTVAVAQRDALLKPATTAKRLLGERMAAWEQAQTDLRREAEAAAQRERERLEREAREQAEAEQRRLQREAEDRRLQEAALMEAAGDRAGAERLVSQPVAAPVVSPAPVFTPRPPVAAAPKVEGVSFRDEWDFVIENAALLPQEYTMPDEKKIRGVVKALRASTHIPGVRAFSRRVSAVRTG